MRKEALLLFSSLVPSFLWIAAVPPPCGAV